jgi:hypothetical protein
MKEKTDLRCYIPVISMHSTSLFLFDDDTLVDLLVGGGVACAGPLLGVSDFLKYEKRLPCFILYIQREC